MNRDPFACLKVAMWPIAFLAFLCFMASLTQGCTSIDERRAYRVCGPDGTVDWDNYPARPACNRNGWNGHSYQGQEL